LFPVLWHPPFQAGAFLVPANAETIFGRQAPVKRCLARIAARKLQAAAKLYSYEVAAQHFCAERPAFQSRFANEARNPPRNS